MAGEGKKATIGMKYPTCKQKFTSTLSGVVKFLFLVGSGVKIGLWGLCVLSSSPYGFVCRLSIVSFHYNKSILA